MVALMVGLLLGLLSEWFVLWIDGCFDGCLVDDLSFEWFVRWIDGCIDGWLAIWSLIWFAVSMLPFHFGQLGPRLAASPDDGCKLLKRPLASLPNSLLGCPAN